MFILSTIILVALVYFQSLVTQYIKSLTRDIILTTNKKLQTKINYTFISQYTQQAIKIQIAWVWLYSPLNAFAIGILSIFLTSSWTGFLPEWIPEIIPYVMATALTPILTFKKPIWMEDWHSHILLGTKLVQLDQLTEQLCLLRDTLKEMVDNNHKPDEMEALAVQTQAQFLITLSQTLAQNIIEHSQELNIECPIKEI